MDAPIRVLLVDDVADFAAVAAELLEREDDRLGYTHDELLSMRPADIDPTADAESEDERIENFEQGRIERFDTVLGTKSGARIPVEIDATLIPYRGETAILSTVRDVSDRVERERELERRNDRLEEVASVVPHDLRNPLNVAAGRIARARRVTPPISTTRPPHWNGWTA